MIPTNSEFIVKLFRMLEEPENYPYISWSRDGRSFVISNQEGFSEFVLERHFRHRNWSSFVRQLNKYDFYKMKADGDPLDDYEVLPWEYKNKYFQRGRPDLLSKIKRKKAPSEKSGSSGDPNLRKIENSIVYQAHVLNTVKEISKYLKAVTEDVNEIKKWIYHEKRLCESQMNILFIQQPSFGSSYVHDILKQQSCTVKTVESSQDVKEMRIVKEEQDAIVLYATSLHCSATINAIRTNDVKVPIILIVDEGFREGYVGTLGIGATDVLLMPFPEDELVGLINRYKKMEI